jgi:hypothetical protein
VCISQEVHVQGTRVVVYNLARAGHIHVEGKAYKQFHVLIKQNYLKKPSFKRQYKNIVFFTTRVD